MTKRMAGLWHVVAALAIAVSLACADPTSSSDIGSEAAIGPSAPSPSIMPSPPSNWLTMNLYGRITTLDTLAGLLEVHNDTTSAVVAVDADMLPWLIALFKGTTAVESFLTTFGQFAWPPELPDPGDMCHDLSGKPYQCDQSLPPPGETHMNVGTGMGSIGGESGLIGSDGPYSTDNQY